jgi:chromosome segregation ATPase
VNSIQKDEKIGQLEAELLMTTKGYREALEKKLQDTENLVAELESEKQILESEIERCQERVSFCFL